MLRGDLSAIPLPLYCVNSAISAPPFPDGEGGVGEGVGPAGCGPAQKGGAEQGPLHPLLQASEHTSRYEAAPC
jgi:hypothetical protein